MVPMWSRENERFCESQRSQRYTLELLCVPQHTNHSVCETGRERMNIGGGLSDDNTTAARFLAQIPTV